MEFRQQFAWLDLNSLNAKLLVVGEDKNASPCVAQLLGMCACARALHITKKKKCRKHKRARRLRPVSVVSEILTGIGPAMCTSGSILQNRMTDRGPMNSDTFKQMCMVSTAKRIL